MHIAEIHHFILILVFSVSPVVIKSSKLFENLICIVYVGMVSKVCKGWMFHSAFFCSRMCSSLKST